MTTYEVFAATEFPNHPEWPVYEAPAKWFIDPTFKKENENV